MATCWTVSIGNCSTVYMGGRHGDAGGSGFGLRHWRLCRFLLWDGELPADQLGVVGEGPGPGASRSAPDHRSGGKVGTGCCCRGGGRLGRAGSGRRVGFGLALRLPSGEQCSSFGAIIIVCTLSVSVRLAEREWGGQDQILSEICRLLTHTQTVLILTVNCLCSGKGLRGK